MGNRDDDHLDRSVRLRRERRERAKQEGELTLAQSLAWMGTLGWLIAVPMVAGMFLGRWLDRELATGVTLASSLSVAGLVAGCWFAWRKVQRR
jgi:ATP synthase protein I